MMNQFKDHVTLLSHQTTESFTVGHESPSDGSDVTLRYRVDVT